MPNTNFNKLKVFVEGSTDQGYVQFLFEEFFGDSFPNERAVADAIIDCKGWTNLGEKLQLADTPRRKAEGGLNLILFDADSGRNHGGYARRRQSIEAVIGNYEVPSETYLFPDNASDGDLEDYYCSCFKPEFAFFNDCWDTMITCLQKGGNGLALSLPYAHEKVFSYVDLFQDYKTGTYKNTKTKRSHFDAGLWVHDRQANPALDALLSFLEQHRIVI